LATHSDGTVRDGKEAFRLAEQACRLTKYRQAQFVSTLAAAYAELGQFDKAVETTQIAANLAQARGLTSMIPILEKLRDLYRSGAPYREGVN
jgi:hypothetical protein